MLLRRHIFISGLIVLEIVLILSLLRLVLYRPRAGPIVLENMSLPLPRYMSSEASISAPVDESSILSASLDYDGVINGYEVVRGWAFLKGQETRDQKVYVQVEKADGRVVHYATTSTLRPDVGAAFKTSLYDVAGFEASIPLRDGTDADVGPLRLVVKNRNGTYKSGCNKVGVRQKALSSDAAQV